MKDPNLHRKSSTIHIKAFNKPLFSGHDERLIPLRDCFWGYDERLIPVVAAFGATTGD